MSKKKWYRYYGPVLEHDICVARNWDATTFAPSAKKALSNLSFRFKKDNNRPYISKVTLDPKCLTEIGGD